MKSFTKTVGILMIIACVLAMSVNADVILNRNVTHRTGLSTDTKPTLAEKDAGSTFHETDTNTDYKWNGSAWGEDEGTYTAAAQTLTSKTSTTAIAYDGYERVTWAMGLTALNTDLVVYIEIRTEDIGWMNIDANNDSTFFDANGNYGWTWKGVADSTRATISVGSSSAADFAAKFQAVFGGAK